MPPETPASANPPTRLILYVGKGGVGKTTMAAATAVRAAALGHRTLVVSTDIAHSLGDVLQVELGADPAEIGERLFAYEVNVLDEARRSWGKMQGQLADFLKREGVSEVQADELAIMPGMEEVAALVQIRRQSRTGQFDCIVVDAAPTGETIRLLSMPDSLLWYAGRLQEWRGRLMRFVGPLLRNALPDFNVIETMTQLAERTKELRQDLTNPERSSYRIVVTPDTMVIKEARRAETYLNLFDYPIDAVIVNRLLPAADAGNAYLDAMLARQQRAMAEVRSTFATLPLLEAPLSAEEPLGLSALAALSQQVFGDRDPTLVLHRGATQHIERQGNGYLLQIPMPNVEVTRLSLLKRGDELYVDVGNFRREITLPLTLAALEPGTARVHGGMLEIPFSAAPSTIPAAEARR
jgi:arsenite/tail-anchored protein-transporting ATPase